MFDDFGRCRLGSGRRGHHQRRKRRRPVASIRNSTDGRARPRVVNCSPCPARAFAPGRAFLSFVGAFPHASDPCPCPAGILLLACSASVSGWPCSACMSRSSFLLIVVGVAWDRIRRVARSGWSHGTARLRPGRFGPLTMLGHDGLILGTTGFMPRPTFWEGLCGLWSPSKPGGYRLLPVPLRPGRFEVGSRPHDTDQQSFTHLATFAPTGRGKGISVLIVNLLSYRFSCVVTDPKGELFQLTAEHRRRNSGIASSGLIRAELCGPGSDTCNPLDFIDDKADDFLDQCRDAC